MALDPELPQRLRERAEFYEVDAQDKKDSGFSLALPMAGLARRRAADLRAAADEGDQLRALLDKIGNPKAFDRLGELLHDAGWWDEAHQVHALAALAAAVEGTEPAPCPTCNDDGVVHTLDGDPIGPCPTCSTEGGTDG